MTRTFKIGGVVAILAFVFLFAMRPGFVRTQASEDADDVAIYQMLLGTMNPQPGQSLVLSQNTLTLDTLLHSKNDSPLDRAQRSLPKRMVDDFIRRNQLSIAIPKLSAQVPLIYAPHARLEHMLKEHFVTACHKAYPTAESWVEFARPGYNRDGTAALVHYRYWVPLPDGWLGGGDATFYLEKVAGHWTIVRNILVIKS